MDEIIKNKNIFIQYNPNTLKNFSSQLFNIDYISKERLIKSEVNETLPSLGKGKKPSNLYSLKLHQRTANNSIEAFLRKLGTKKYFAPIRIPNFESVFFSSKEIFFKKLLNFSTDNVPKFSNKLN